MGKTQKSRITLESGDAYVVADWVFWDHVIRMYESQAEHSEDEWQQMANHIRGWVDSTYYVNEEEDQDRL